ncbi:MAG: excinuclease ABC subunit UvrC [Monoglobaceae bacterium]
MDKIKEKLKNLPMCPGVYIMHDSSGEVIYVGKSKLLKNRVSQYFMNSKNHTPKTLAMVEHVADFDYIMTDTEVEALVLECNLIKKYRPKYNILLKDDKQYPYIKLTLGEPYPRVYITRKVIRDGSKYFGPYMSSYNVKNALETIKRVFKVRSCSKRLSPSQCSLRPCLYHHIGQCSAPCSGNISQEEYRDTFNRIEAVLDGKYTKITAELENMMYKASDKLEFEKAARYRDRIEALKILGEKQKMISTSDDNRDIIGIYKGELEYCIQVFYMRGGKIQGSEYFVINEIDSGKEEVLSEFVKQYYFTATNIPKEILLSDRVEDIEEIEAWLSEKTGHRIKLLVPVRGEKAKLINTVIKNAEESLRQHIFKMNREISEQNDVLAELSELLSLKKIPFRIESYDISNISGAESVGVCVVYNNAKPAKKCYRKFNIKTVDGADDYESTKEVIARRINRAYSEAEAIERGELEEEKAKFLPLPDLILLDGGKGHVSTIRLLMETLGEDIEVFGMVKDDNHRTRTITDDTTEYDIDIDSRLFRFLYELQEEVHRFAIEAFRKRHENASVFSALEAIDGVGPAKRKKLLNVFMSIDRIKAADINELSEVVDRNTAANVYNYFHEGDGDNGQA